MCDLGEPLLPDGTPDYYAMFVQWMTHIDSIKVAADSDKAIHEMMSSDQNGFRDFLAALGPGLLVPDPSHSLQDAGGWGVPWNEWATNPRTKPYDEIYWRPACEQIGSLRTGRTFWRMIFQFQNDISDESADLFVGLSIA